MSSNFSSGKHINSRNPINSHASTAEKRSSCVNIPTEKIGAEEGERSQGDKPYIISSPGCAGIWAPTGPPDQIESNLMEIILINCQLNPKTLKFDEFLYILETLGWINSVAPSPRAQEIRECLETIMTDSPGVLALERFAKADLGRPLDDDAAYAFRGRLIKLLRKPLHEIGSILLLDAVRLLEQTTAAGPAPPSRGEEKTDVARGSGMEAAPPGDPATDSWPQSLDSQAVGIAHEMLQGEGWINVAEVARRLGVERTKLYRCPGFKAMVRTDRDEKRRRKAHYSRGSKDRQTRRLECADDA